MHPKDADRMENNVDPDQTARSSLICVYIVCSGLSVRKLRNIMEAKLLSQFLGMLWYIQEEGSKDLLFFQAFF